MSLLLNGSKTLTIAGTELQCVEIYTGEAYTMPLFFKTSNNVPIDCTGWSMSATAKYYQGNIIYPTTKTVTVSNLLKITPQPSSGAGTYAASLAAVFTNAANGEGYLYIPSNLADGSGSPTSTPLPDLTDTISYLVIVTVTVTRTDSQSGLIDINREPIGFIMRYQ
jgi:hypothetical protein